MSEIKITIGGRPFDVACQEGEEQYLRTAAKMLDTEATALVAQIGRLPEARMLLMSGLMLADKTAGLEEQVRGLDQQQRGLKKKLAQLEAELEAVRNTPLPEPERIEVPVIPGAVIDSLAELAARAESIADDVEEKARG